MLSAEEVISGFNDGTFGPDQLISRRQFAKMAVNPLGLPVSKDDICPFTDVEETPGKLYPANYLAMAAKAGLTKGTTSSAYSPYLSISRAQVLTVMVRVADNFAAGALLAPPPGWTVTVSRRSLRPS